MPFLGHCKIKKELAVSVKYSVSMG